MNSFRLALAFLTRIPLRGSATFEVEAYGRSLLWYPVVGLVIGLLVTVVASISLALLPSPTAAAVTVITWIVVTGAMHLDGLGDCADAWVGAHGQQDQRATTLRILKDPSCGVMGVVALVCAIGLRWGTVSPLLEHDLLVYLCAVPILARTQALALFLVTPYTAENGIGASMFEHIPRRRVFQVFAGTWLLCFVALPWQLASLLACALAVMWFVLRCAMLSRLQGFTGDCAGALIELSELTVLIIVVAYCV